MANQSTRGGTPEQHAKAGEQSHKNTSGGGSKGSGGDSKSGDESKSGGSKSGGDSKSGGEKGTQGGSHEQHVKAGEQSHKNK